MLTSNNQFAKMYKHMSRNVLLIYFALLSLIFTLMLFIPYIGLVLYNAVNLPSVQLGNTYTIRISNHYKWNYNGTKGFGGREKLHRFKKTVSEIEKLNAMESSNVFGITKFSHMSKSEFAEQMLSTDVGTCRRSSMYGWIDCNKADCYHSLLFISRIYYDDVSIRKRVDWRDGNKVSPVLNQRLCNACWAFSIVGIMETMLAINRKQPYTKLSIQELLDCSKYTKKCRGGNINYAMSYLYDSQLAIVPDSQYPLTLHNEDCKVGPNVPGTRLKRFTILCNVDEHVIPKIIATHGPVMVVVNAAMWQYYTGGIIRRSCISGDYDFKHVVQVVGYDMTGETPYYIVRNSWGTDFGEDGYVKLAMFENVCGITREIAYLDVY